MKKRGISLNDSPSLFLDKKIERRRNAVLTKTQSVFMILELLYVRNDILSTCLL